MNAEPDLFGPDDAITTTINQHEGAKYLRTIRSAVDPAAELPVDVYAVLEAFGVTCPARQHAIKKLLCAGIRGKGSEEADLIGALAAVNRAVELQRGRGNPAHAPVTLASVLAGETMPPSVLEVRQHAAGIGCRQSPAGAPVFRLMLAGNPVPVVLIENHGTCLRVKEPETMRFHIVHLRDFHPMDRPGVEALLKTLPRLEARWGSDPPIPSEKPNDCDRTVEP